MSSLVGMTAISGINEENKVHYSLTQEKLRINGIFAILLFFGFAVVFAGKWVAFEISTSSHESKSHDMYQYNGHLQDINYRVANAMIGYCEMMNFEVGKIRGGITDADSVDYNNYYPNNDSQTALDDKMYENIEEAYDIISYLMANLSLSTSIVDQTVLDSIFSIQVIDFYEPTGTRSIHMNVIQQLEYLLLHISHSNYLSERYSGVESANPISQEEIDSLISSTNFSMTEGYHRVFNRSLTNCEVLRRSIEKQVGVYDSEFIYILAFSTGLYIVIVVLFGLVLMDLQKDVGFIFQSYSFVPPSKINKMIKKIEKEEFRCEHLDALEGFGDTLKSFNSLGTQKSGTMREIENKNKVEYRQRMKKGSLKTVKPFPAVCWIMVYNTIMICVLTMSQVLLITIRSYVKLNDVIRPIGALNSERIIEIHIRSTGMYMMSPFILPITNKLIPTDSYSDLVESYQSEWNTWRQKLNEIGFGSIEFEHILYGDICDLITKEQDRNLCQLKNRGIAKNGALHFSNFETKVSEAYFLGVKNSINTFGQNAAPGNMDYDITDTWYSDSNIEIRLGHNIIFDILYPKTAQIFKDKINQTSNKISGLLLSLKLIGVCMVVIPLCVFIVLSYKQIKYTYRVSFQTFRIISPRILISNQFLMSRFKRYFEVSHQ